MAAWLIILAICIPWLGALLLWRMGDDHPQIQRRLAVLFASLSALAGIALLTTASSETVIDVRLTGFGEIAFRPDGLGVVLTAVASVIGGLAVLFSLGYMAHEEQLSRYFGLVFLFIGAMCALVLTDSLLLLFFFWELVAVCSYMLIAFHNDDPNAVAGGIRAFLITGLGGIGLLAGTLVARAYLGSDSIATVLLSASQLPAGALAVIAFGFLIAAAAKSAQVPFHTWLPGAMEAPTPISALIHAATMVNAGVYLLARFYPAFSTVPGWSESVITIGVLSALMAGVMALTATDLKRVLAYSTISQLGFMFYAVGIGAIFASQFHLLSHAIFKALLFLTAGAITYTVGTRDLRKMGGLGKQLPFLRNVFIIGALALCGVPSLNGFWSKELILEAGARGPLWPYLGMLLGVFLTALYTFRLVWLVFFGAVRSTEQPAAHPLPSSMTAALSLLAVGAGISWLVGGPFSVMLHDTLPFHALEPETTGVLITATLSAPATWLVLGILLVAVLVWQTRIRWLIRITPALKVPTWLAENDFGFVWLNQRVVAFTEDAARNLQKLQTGQVNLNMASLALGLLTLLVILALGGAR